MKKLLLTGGSGFIGKNILESYLSEKYEIIAPSHNELDITDTDAVALFFRENAIDYVIHCALKPAHRNIADRTGVFEDNNRMFFNLERNHLFFEKMIVLGSGAAYDMRYYQPKMKEDYFGVHIPVDNYGMAKYVSEMVIDNSRNILNLRLFGLFGKHETYSIRFISNLICKALFDLPLTMNQNRQFDYLYIDDLMPVLDHFLMNDSKYKSYNVTPDKSIELLHIAEIIQDISGKILPVIPAIEGIGSEYSGDNSRLKNELTNLRFTPIYKAIEKLYSWYAENISMIDKDELLIDK